LSEPGAITVDADGKTRFGAVGDGRHRYLVVDPAQKTKVIETFTTMASAQPAPRGRGRGGGAADLFELSEDLL
jgi:hypothetical protein